MTSARKDSASWESGIETWSIKTRAASKDESALVFAGYPASPIPKIRIRPRFARGHKRNSIKLKNP